MQILTPFALDASNASSNMAENDAPVWNAQTNYSTGDIVLYNHRLFESLTANSGIDPLADSTAWLNLKPSNATALFDHKSGTESQNADSIVITINHPGRIEGIALLGLAAKSVQITATDNGVTLYDKTTSLIDNGALDWYGYFYDSYAHKDVFLALDIPKTYAITIVVTIENTGSIARCAQIIVGQTKVIGRSQFGLGGGIIDYSKKTVDTFGNYSIVERHAAKRRSVDIKISTAQIHYIEKLLHAIRATPALYIASTLENYQHLVLFGLYKQFDIIMSNAITSRCTLTIEELI